MKKNILLVIALITISYIIGYNSGIGNQSLKYGETGLPKNCRALIAANLEGYKYGTYAADEALYSIERNCGPYGIIWDER